MKSCRICNVNKPLIEFYKAKSNKDGYNNMCKECRNLANKSYREENKESIRTTQNKWVEKNREKSKAIKLKYYKNNKEKYKKYYKENANKTQDRRKSYNSAYKKKNRAHFNFKESVRRSTKKNATPDWANFSKIEILYKKCKWLETLTGFKYEVDHIIPLQSNDVCGLHVWQNLQILEVSLNRSKSNKFNGGSPWQF